MYFSRTTHSLRHRQRGAAFMVMVVILIVGVAAFLVSSLSSIALQYKRDEITANALAQAKEALIGRAASDLTLPGQLPCPENTALIGTPNEGTALANCNTFPAIGRLPWKTLKLGDIRDGNGDKLWYVLSAGFRVSPINSDTPAQLTVDLVPNQAVAIIFSPGTPIAGQSRDDPIDVTKFLDLSNNTGGNNFVTTGPAATFNDRLMIVTHDDLFHVVEKRVVKEVINALNEFYCDIGYVNPAGGCTDAVHGKRYYPRPADFNDWSCQGSGNLSSWCTSGAGTAGRIPANLATDAWDITSILQGKTPPPLTWFQSNKWREVIFYAVAPSCTDGTIDCASAAGYLTLNNPLGTAQVNQKVVVIATGSALTAPLQTRTIQAEIATIGNYLEDENLTPLDNIFTRSVASPATPFNDIAVSIP